MYFYWQQIEFGDRKLLTDFLALIISLLKAKHIFSRVPIFIIALECLITSLDFLNREDPSYTIETLENDTIVLLITLNLLHTFL